MVKEIEKLIEIAKISGIKSMNIKTNGVKVSFSFSSSSEVIETIHEVGNVVEEEVSQEEVRVEVKSNYVGRLKLNDKKGTPISTEGKTVKKGDLLCNIEVLEILHEVTSPCDGVITKILLKDGDIVEYGAVIMEIKPS